MQSAIVPVDVVALKTNLLWVVLSTSKGVPTMLVPSILSPAGVESGYNFYDGKVKLVVFRGNAIVGIHVQQILLIRCLYCPD